MIRCALNVGPGDAQTVGDRIEMRLGRFTKFRLWKREKQPLAVDLDVDQTLAALLHQPASRPRLEAAAQHGVRRPDRRMAREPQFPSGREDPQTVVSSLVGRRADERRLREVGPGRDQLHLLARQSVTVENDRDRVAFEGTAVKTSTCWKARDFMLVSC